MTRVLGIDPSLTATGVAIVQNGPRFITTVTDKGKRTDGVADRDARLARITERVLDHATGVALAVIEGPAITRNAGSAWDRAGLWWRIVHRLHTADIPVAVCPPSTRARWATGRGNADKAAVAVAVARLWPDADLDDDNQADALALATIGAQHLGLDIPALARHHDARAAVAWPQGLAL